jgi:hypothetical protein
MSASSQLYSSPDYVAFPAIVADVDLLANDPKGRKRTCIRITVQNAALGVAGVIVVQRGDGVNVTVPIYGGQSREIQAAKIIAVGTTATGLLVHW